MRKWNQGIGNEILRLLLFFMLDVVVEGFFLYGAYILCFHGTGILTAVMGICVLVTALCWLWLAWSIFNRAGAVSLSENGVAYRALFVTHRCRWEDIRLAGVLRLKNTKLGERYELVLRKPIGGLEESVPTELGLTNDWKWVHLPSTPQFRKFVEKHYGPLDFDYAK